MLRQSKKDHLQEIADKAYARKDFTYYFMIEFRGAGGWWAIPENPRWFQDEGEFLGMNYVAALKQLHRLLG